MEQIFPNHSFDGFKSAIIDTALVVFAPGYEDDAWCPAGWCLQEVEVPDGFVGPASSYVECRDPNSRETCDEVWTGSSSNVVAPDGWEIATDCEDTGGSASC